MPAAAQGQWARGPQRRACLIFEFGILFCLRGHPLGGTKLERSCNEIVEFVQNTDGDITYDVPIPIHISDVFSHGPFD